MSTHSIDFYEEMAKIIFQLCALSAHLYQLCVTAKGHTVFAAIVRA